MLYFLYVVQCSDARRSLYAGISPDVEARIRKHNQGRGAKYTRTRRPVVLLAYWEYPDRSAASKAEYAFKRLRREEKLRWIAAFQPKHGTCL